MEAPRSLRFGFRRRLPVLLQTEAAECGLACLAMIASYHGLSIDLAALRRRFPTSLRGVTLGTLIDVAGQLGLATRAVRLELEDLPALRRPCLLHWRLDHFVVLEAANARRLRIHDPAIGKRTLSMVDASAAFTGVALELWPGADFQPGKERHAASLRSVLGNVRGLLGSLGQILLLALVLEVFALTSPLLLQWVIDHVLVTANVDLLTILALGFALIVVLQQATAALRAWALMRFGATFSVQWQANVFTHLLRLPMDYFDKRHLGDIVSRFRSVDAVQRTLSSALVEGIVDGLMSIFIGVVLFTYNAALAVVCVSAVALYGLSRYLSYGPLLRASEEEIVNAAKQESQLLETVRGVRTVKLFRRETERRSSWLTLLVNQVNASLRIQRLHVWYRSSNGLLFGLENVLVIWIGARLVLDAQFSLGMLLAFISYKTQFSSRISALIDKLLETRMLSLHARRIGDIVSTEPENACRTTGRLALGEHRGIEPQIGIDNVHYRYGSHEPLVLSGLSLAIASGESVAIVGPSGCGKSTLLHLMLGMLQPTHGTISIGGVNLAQLDVDVLRRTIGSVTQHDTLFAGSIAENISFFDTQMDLQRVEQCARLAAIHTDIIGMPMAYNTMIGYMGTALSGGQQQRILLARALYKRPKILILDEATSHLDMKRELLVTAAVRSLSITRIIVAHRPQTAATADRMVALEGGRIVHDTRLTPNVAALHRTRLRKALREQVSDPAGEHA